MRKAIVVLAACAALVAFEKAHGYVNYPWCKIGDNRSVECAFSSLEQCSMVGSRGFGDRCMRNPDYNPRLPPVIEQTSQSSQADRARRRPIGEPTQTEQRQSYGRW
jgi:hypothetical protein